jgi:hypothetical protein
MWSLNGTVYRSGRTYFTDIWPWRFYIDIPCRGQDLQLSCLVQIFASFSCPLSTVESLYTEGQDSGLISSSRVEIDQWWEFLHPFVAVKNIYLCEIIAFHIVYSLQDLGGGRSIEVLSALQEMFLATTAGVRATGPIESYPLSETHRVRC